VSHALVLIAVWGVAVMAHGADDRVGRPREPVRVKLDITNQRDQWYVGDEIAVAATVTNISETDLFIPDWDQPSLKFMPIWQLNADVREFPGQTKGRPVGRGSGASGMPELRGWEQLEAGATSRAKTQEFVAMLPGMVCIDATFNCDFLAVQRMTEKGQERFFPYRRGVVLSHDNVSITLPAMTSPAMAAKYRHARETILDDETTLEERLEALSRIAGQKHYFAARFVLDIWKHAKTLEVKEAALLHLIDLLGFGTAYEAMPELLDALADDLMPLDARKRMLNVLDTMHLTSEYPGFRIADMAGYRLPEAVHRKALEVIRELTSSAEPALAEKAREILQQSRPKEPKGLSGPD
ncbi:MAG: hypothetical protein U1E05_25465, partial [Patescibacteria group bacterium]|nr:hypothetical protein [Patescibacteria group bacterium]